MAKYDPGGEDCAKFGDRVAMISAVQALVLHGLLLGRAPDKAWSKFSRNPVEVLSGFCRILTSLVDILSKSRRISVEVRSNDPELRIWTASAGACSRGGTV